MASAFSCCKDRVHPLRFWILQSAFNPQQNSNVSSRLCMDSSACVCACSRGRPGWVFILRWVFRLGEQQFFNVDEAYGFSGPSPPLPRSPTPIQTSLKWPGNNSGYFISNVHPKKMCKVPFILSTWPRCRRLHCAEFKARRTGGSFIGTMMHDTLSWHVVSVLYRCWSFSNLNK